MKAVISNRIYLQPETPDHYLLMEKALTYKIDSYRVDKPPEIIKNMRRISGDVISIPVGRIDLVPTSYEIKDKRVLAPVYFPKFKFDLNPSQKEVYDEVNDNCLINAPVSWGKTFTALAIAGKLGQKTLVVTHTVALRTQWEEEVQKVFGIKAGIIGSGIFDMDSPIVIGNTKTLYNRREKICKEFGTIIVDECHHIPAATFNKLVDSNYARYKIGLSGTLDRKDGKHVLIPDYFGDRRHTPKAENYMKPKVDVIQSSIRFMDGANIPWALRVNDLVSQNDYGELIAVLGAAYRAKGHSVLIVSDRVYFLKRLAKTFGDKAVIITGETPLAERKKLLKSVLEGKVKILLGTQSIFSEGISVNSLSCLILASVVSNVPLLTQLIGRVVRKHPNKPQPIVVDINLKGKTAERQSQLRRGHYMKEGYQVSTIQV